MNFLNTYLMLENLDKTVLSEASQKAAPINLADCRMVNTNVVDIRGELETNACLIYNNELTRVQVRTVILRESPDGLEFLAQHYGRGLGLPGGGYDITKDNGDILNTAKREAYEEFNFNLTNIKDTGIAVWSHREDPWVSKHVDNPEDRWTGYYSYYVVGNLAGISDNDKPEELFKWTWYPVSKLKNINKEVYDYIVRLNEAIHPDKKGRTDLGEISYLCNSLSTLRKILSRMEIQKTYVSEVRYEVGQNNGNTQRQKQMSLSTSTDLTGHAERRADKWGFGVILDGQVLSKYYDIEHYNHADHKLSDLYISKIVKLKPGALQDSRLIVALGEYGNRIISSNDNADIRLYQLLLEFLNANKQYLYSAKTLRNNYVSKKDPTKWSKHPFGYEKNSEWCDSRFTKLTVDQIEAIFAWESPFSRNAIPIKAIKDFSDKLHDGLIDIFKVYSSFDEKEERIWVENNLVNFIQIPTPALKGIILPDFFKEDYEAITPENNHIAWLKQFVVANNLKVLWHKYSVPEYYKNNSDNANNTAESERTWLNVDTAANNPQVILNRAKMNKFRFMHNLITKQTRDQNSPISVVATAAVKLAIDKYMQDLTAENYEAKYAKALNAAKEYFAETLEKGKLTDKPNKQLEELFDYYCPDPPESDNVQ